MTQRILVIVLLGIAIAVVVVKSRDQAPAPKGAEPESTEVERKSIIDIKQLEAATDAFLDRVDRFHEKAAEYDEKEILGALLPNKHNGYYYRFDDHLSDASVADEPPNSAATQRATPLLAFEFDDKSDKLLRLQTDHFVFKDGAVQFKAFDSRPVYPLSTVDLALDPNRLGEIEIRVRASTATELFFAWAKAGKPFRTAAQEHGYHQISISIEPDEAYRVYRVPTASMFKSRVLSERPQRITTIYFWAAELNNQESQVELDYLRLYSKSRKYSRSSFGTDYEILDLQMRKVLFANTPVEVVYPLELPSVDGLRLSFGMGILVQGDPIRFRVMIRDDDTEHWIFDETVETPNQWFDKELDLGVWRGREIQIHFLSSSGQGNVALWSNPVVIQRPPDRFNIIVWLEDAFRAGHMSSYGYKRHATTPIKDAFFADGVRFARAISQATKTRPSTPSFMTSLYPTVTGVWQNPQYLRDEYLTLAEVLRSQGFATAAFVQNVNAGPGNGIHQGFSFVNDFVSIGERADKRFFDEFFAFLEKKRDRNFFAYVHLLDPHGEYDPPPPYDEWHKKYRGTDFIKRHSGLDPDEITKPTHTGRINRYDGEIRYNDQQFNLLLEKLRASGLLDNTLIVFMSDHGEQMGEHNQWEHNPPGYVQGLHVPLLMRYPKKLPPKTAVVPTVQLLDLMPTVLELAGVDGTNIPMQGDSLLPLLNGDKMSYWQDRLSISEEVVRRATKDTEDASGSIFYRNWHLLFSSSEPGKKHTRANSIIGFDLARDPQEENPHLIDKNDPLYGLIKDFMKTYQGRNIDAARKIIRDLHVPTTLDPEQQDQLKALGYLN